MDFEPKRVVFHCRPSDIRRVGINCRCGQRSIYECPEQIASGRSLHPCPKCGSLYEIHRDLKNVWQIIRTGDNLRDMSFMRE